MAQRPLNKPLHDQDKHKREMKSIAFIEGKGVWMSPIPAVSTAN